MTAENHDAGEGTVSGKLPPPLLLSAARERAANTRYQVKIDASAKGAAKVILPEIPDAGDSVGLCCWLTGTWELDPEHPVTGAIREGRLGPEGHIAVLRAGAPAIRFEPGTRVNTPPRLIESLSGWLLPSDGQIHAFNAGHCRQISYVLRMLCGLHDGLTSEQEAAAIVSTFLQRAIVADGSHTTYRTRAERYAAAVALSQELPRYFIDTQTGEYVISVSDLQDAARRHEGSSLPHGWLDGRMHTLGWTRITLDGKDASGRHARIFAYRGILADTDEETTATT